MKQTCKFLIGLVVAAGMAGTMAAQAPEGITNAAEYDAWKLQFATGEVPQSTHPAAAKSGARDTDGPCACWIGPDSSWTAISNADPNQWTATGYGNGDDGSFGPVLLPFTFQFYGQAFDTMYININGNVSFRSPIASYSPSGFPVGYGTVLAPFWSDVDLRGAGEGVNRIYYKITPHAIYVSWADVGHWNQQTERLNSFQVILSDGTDPVIPGGNNVSFCYGNMEWTASPAAGGSNGFGGVPAMVGANLGNGVDYLQFGRFNQPGDAYDGPFGQSDGVDWLIDRHFVFSTESEEIPPVFTNTECDTVEIDVGSSFDYSMLILSGAPGQTVLATAESPTFSNFTSNGTSETGQYELVLSMQPGAGDVGLHAITITAEVDQSAPALTSSFVQYVKVMLTTDVRELAGSTGLSLVPNPSSGHSTLHWPAGQAPQRVDVLAADGKLVLAEAPHAGSDRLEIDLSGQPEGAYLVRAIGTAGTQALRLMKTSPR